MFFTEIEKRQCGVVEASKDELVLKVKDSEEEKKFTVKHDFGLKAKYLEDLDEILLNIVVDEDNDTEVTN